MGRRLKGKEGRRGVVVGSEGMVKGEWVWYGVNGEGCGVFRGVSGVIGMSLVPFFYLTVKISLIYLFFKGCFAVTKHEASHGHAPNCQGFCPNWRNKQTKKEKRKRK